MRDRPRPRPGSHGSRRTAVLAGPVAGLALASMLLTGCSGTGEDAGSSAGSSAASPSASSASSSSGATSSDSASATPSSASSMASPGGSGDSLASKDFTVTTTYAQLPATIRFDIVSLQRRDDLLQLVARLTNTSTDRSKDMRWQVANRFDPDVSREDLGTFNGIFGGVVLTDLANKKRYLVAADSGKDCVCTSDLSGTFIGAGQSIDLVATYAAPPTSTTQLDAEVPSLGLFRDLPVS